MYIYIYIYKGINDSVKRHNKLGTLNNQQVLRVRLLHVPAICYLLPICFRLASSKNGKMRETLLGTKEVFYNSKK